MQPADLRYEPEDYRALMQAALQSKAQAVFGVRPERNLSWAERWRCKALAFAAKEFFAMPWTDPGALLLVERALAQEIRLHRDGLNLWSALLSAVVKAKATVASVPTRYYPGGWFAEKASDGMDFFRGDFRTVLVSALRGLSISTLRTHWDGFRKRLSA